MRITVAPNSLFASSLVEICMLWLSPAFTDAIILNFLSCSSNTLCSLNCYRPASDLHKTYGQIVSCLLTRRNGLLPSNVLTHGCPTSRRLIISSGRCHGQIRELGHHGIMSDGAVLIIDLRARAKSLKQLPRLLAFITFISLIIVLDFRQNRSRPTSQFSP